MVEQNLPTKARSEAGWISVPFDERHWHRSAQVARGTVPMFSGGYGLCTKSAQSRGLENIGPKRPLPGFLAPMPVLSPSRITLEHNGKIRPRPDGEKAFAGASGGAKGIRTARSHPLDHFGYSLAETPPSFESADFAGVALFGLADTPSFTVGALTSRSWDASVQTNFSDDGEHSDSFVILHPSCCCGSHSNAWYSGERKWISSATQSDRLM